MPRARSFLHRVASAAHVRRGKMAIAVVLAALAVVAIAAVVLAAPAVLVAVVAVVPAAPAVMTQLLRPQLPQLQRLPPRSNFPYNSNF